MFQLEYAALTKKNFMIVVFYDIDWVTEDSEYNDDLDQEFDKPELPTEVLVHQNFFLRRVSSNEKLEYYLDEYGADFLTDEYDFHVNSFSFKIVEDTYNYEWVSDGRYQIFHNFFFKKLASCSAFNSYLLRKLIFQ